MTTKQLGPYTIIEEVGRGGMATVYRAYQPSVERDVAIKVIKPGIAAEEDTISRFQREARLIANLEHPHILPVYDFDGTHDPPYIVMRYLESGTLKDVLMRQSIPLNEIAYLLQQVASALDYAHRRAIVHRDIKPSNIMIDSEGNAFVADFGLARILVTQDANPLSADDSIIGTPHYMSPEQVSGEYEVDGRADIYALGVMLFELLAGQLPFAGANPMSVLYKHVYEPVPSLHAIRSDLPARIDSVIMRAMAKTPDGRYATASELAAAFTNTVGSSAAVTPIHLRNAARQSMLLHQGEASPHETHLVQPESSISLRDRRLLLEKVRKFWIEGVLEKSLGGVALLELGLEEDPRQVEHPWSLVLETLEDQTPRTFPEGMTILEVFTELEKAMLILGEPGAGKTTTLLELAREALEVAWETLEAPIPLVFNLASWTPKETLSAWLLRELNEKYNVPQRIGRKLIDRQEMLLLLDGLDEVQRSDREACIRALNAFRADNGLTPIAVCSRIEDYESLEARLKLTGAISLKPLTDEQIQHYLSQADESLRAVADLLDKDDELRELARSPLMLNVMTLAYKGLPIEQIVETGDSGGRRAHLFETYIDRMYKRRVGDKAYDLPDIKRWLGWLAAKLMSKQQTIFLLERIQPDWREEGEGALYAFWLFVLNIVFGMPVGLLTGVLIALVESSIEPLFAGIANGVFGAVLFTVIPLLRKRVSPLERVGWSRKKFTEQWWKRLGIGAGVGFGLIITTGLLVQAVNPEVTLLPGYSGLIAGGLIGLISSGIEVSQASETEKPNQGMRRTLNYTLVTVGGVGVVLFALMSVALFVSLPPDQPFTTYNSLVIIYTGVRFAVPLAFTAGLIVGGLTVLQHASLRLLFAQKDRLPLRAVTFLNTCCDLIYMRKVGGGYIFTHRLIMEHFAAHHRE